MSAATRYKPNIANFHLSLFISFDYYFSQSVHKAFYSYTFERGIDMLPKRSTPVDQNLGSESIHSQLSVAIFIARRIHLGPQKSVIYEKKSKNYRTHKQPPPFWLHFGTKYLYRNIGQICWRIWFG